MLKNLFLTLFFLLLTISCTNNVIIKNTEMEVSSDSIKKAKEEVFRLSLIIKDAISKKPLEKVKVSISDTTGLNMSFQSDKDGKVEIVLQKASNVLISYFYEGYQAFVIFENIEKNSSTKEILLKPVYSIIITDKV